MCPPSPWIPAFAGTTETTVDFPASIIRYGWHDALTGAGTLCLPSPLKLSPSRNEIKSAFYFLPLVFVDRQVGGGTK